MKSSIFNYFFLIGFITSCHSSEQLTQTMVTGECASIHRPDQFFIYRNEETILHAMIDGVPLTDVVVKISNGIIISCNMGVCIVKVTEGTSTKLSLYNGKTNEIHLEREFKVIDR